MFIPFYYCLVFLNKNLLNQKNNKLYLINSFKNNYEQVFCNNETKLHCNYTIQPMCNKYNTKVESFFNKNVCKSIQV